MKRLSFFRLTSYALLITLLLWNVAQATTYYVAKNGNDSNPGTEARPWLTIQKAANTLIAGDSVFVKRGVYNERVTVRNSGGPGTWITFAPYPGDTVTIDGTGIPITWGGLFEVEGKRYIKVSGFRVTNSGYAGLWVGGPGASHVIFSGNYTYNTYSSGIAAWGEVDTGQYDGITNLIIENNEVELANNDGAGENITVAQGVDSFEVRNNHIHHGGPGTNGGEGIDTKEGVRNGKVYSNRVHHLRRLGIYVDAWDRHTSNIEVYQNVVYECEAGFAVSSEAGGFLENVNIYDDIAYKTRGNGLVITDWGGAHHPMRNIKIVNNTLHQNGDAFWGGGILCSNPEAGGVVIRNNICSQNLSFQMALENGVVRDSFTVDHNLIDGFRGYPGEIYGRDSVVGDPRFVDTANANFHLRSTSPAIDRGSALGAPSFDFDGTPRPQGAGYDIGAYEYRSNRVEEEHGQELAVRDQGFQAIPNPFASFVTIPGHGQERFSLYDISGRRVGTYKGDRIGEGLRAGVYFLRPEGKNAKPLRIVKIR